MSGEAGVTHEVDQMCHREQVQWPVLSLKDVSPNRSHVSGSSLPILKVTTESCALEIKKNLNQPHYFQGDKAQNLSSKHCYLGQAEGLRKLQS